MSRRAGVIADDIWEQYKPTILRLYLSEGCSRNELMDKMRELGFSASKNQFEHKLRKWGFRQNLTGAVWKYVDREIKKRKREGKQDTDVVLSGVRVPKAKVEKECKRYGFVSTIDMLQRAPSPEAPDGMALYICTPPQLALEFSWPSDLPWLTFQARNLQNRLVPLVVLPDTATKGEAIVKFIDQLIPAPQTSPFNLASMIQNGSISRLAAAIGRVMPEAFPGENFSRASELLNGSGADVIKTTASLLLYGIANNHLDDWVAFWDLMTVLRHFPVGLSQWKRILDGPHNISAAVLKEKLFGAAVAGGYVGLVRILLALGADPDRPFQGFSPSPYNNGVATPLGYAASRHWENMVAVLVKAGASLDCTTRLSPLVTAAAACSNYHSEKRICGAEACRMVQIMLSHGAPVNPPRGRTSALGAAAFTGNLPLTKFLIDHGADINQISERSVATHAMGCTWDSKYPSYYVPSVSPVRMLSELTPLVCATLGSHATKPGLAADLNEIHLAKHRESEYDEVFRFLLSSGASIPPDVLVAAARCDRLDVIRVLHERGVDLNAESYAGMSPLLSAVEADRVASCSLLLSLGAKATPVKDHKRYSEIPSALHVAVRNHRLELIELLLPHSDINYSIEPVPEYEWLWDETPSWLTAQRVRGSVEPPKSTFTPLQLSVETGFEEATDLLLKSGAKLYGGELIRSIDLYSSSEHMLQYMIDHGADINETSDEGMTALRTALQCKRDACAQFLIKAGAKIEEQDILLILELGNLSIAENVDIRHGYAPLWGERALAAACAGGSLDLIDTALELYPDTCGTKAMQELVLTFIGIRSFRAEKVMLKRALREHWKDGVRVPPGVEEELILDCVDNRSPKTGIIESMVPVLKRHFVGSVVESMKDLVARELEKRPSDGDMAKTLRRVIDRRRPDITEDWNTCVAIAAYFGNADVLQELLKEPHDGSTCEYPQTISTILSHPADAWSIDSWRSRLRDPEEVPVDGKRRSQLTGKCSVLVAAVKNGNSDILASLLAHGYEPDPVSVYLAVALDRQSMLERLLGSGASPNNAAGRSDSPLQLAARLDRTEMVRMLLDAGANPNLAAPWRSNGLGPPRTALQHAVERGNLTTIDMLIAAAADINAPPAKISGATALQIAAAQGFLGIAKHLIELGADVDADGAALNGKTALEAAADWGRVDVLGFLLDQGVRTDGPKRRQFVQATIYAKLKGHTGALRMLKDFRPWTDEDVELAATLSNKMGPDFLARLRLDNLTKPSEPPAGDIAILDGPHTPDSEPEFGQGEGEGARERVGSFDSSWMDLVNWEE